MPRPSLKDQRSREILDAFVTCVARYGLEGATQERIAAEAGVKRTLLRHYLGNRDEMIAALTDHVVEEYEAMADMLRAELPTDIGMDALIDAFFDPEHQTDPRLTLVFQALIIVVPEHPDMREPLLRSMETFITVIQEHVDAGYPHADAKERRAVALGLTSLYASADSMTPLGPPAAWRQDAKHAAKLLISTLEKNA